MFVLSSLKLNVVVSLGEYINAVVSRIVIGTLDLKQFLPKFKYFCWRQQGLDPLPPLSATVSISNPSGCWRHTWTLPNYFNWPINQLRNPRNFKKHSLIHAPHSEDLNAVEIVILSIMVSEKRGLPFCRRRRRAQVLYDISAREASRIWIISKSLAFSLT